MPPAARLASEIEEFAEEDDGRPHGLLSDDERVLRDAVQQLELLRNLDFAPVISADHNDPPEYHQWSDKLRQKVRTNLFKRPLGLVTEKTDPVAILIVKSMLLTGFDAQEVLWARRRLLRRRRSAHPGPRRLHEYRRRDRS